MISPPARFLDRGSREVAGGAGAAHRSPVAECGSASRPANGWRRRVADLTPNRTAGAPRRRERSRRRQAAPRSVASSSDRYGPSEQRKLPVGCRARRVSVSLGAEEPGRVGWGLRRPRGAAGMGEGRATARARRAHLSRSTHSAPIALAGPRNCRGHQGGRACARDRARMCGGSTAADALIGRDRHEVLGAEQLARDDATRCSLRRGSQRDGTPSFSRCSDRARALALGC